MSKSRRKKKRGCATGVIIFFSLILITVILVSTGVIGKIKDRINTKIYPLKYKEAIVESCEKYDMDPAFICAVIYTESKFKADASSSVGAMGLMQLMPETFEYLASKKGEEVPKDITDPATNIEYGTYYLRYMIDTYGYTDIYTAAAAYNAGPGAVNRWLSEAEYSSDGKTLHTIPYDETENYIDRIKKAEDMYESLYFDK